MGFIKRQQEEINVSRVCGWFVVRPGRGREVELWEKWWPSGFQYKVRIEHCSKSMLISKTFATNENSNRSLQLAASLMERKLDPADVRSSFETFHSEFVSHLWVPPFGGSRWIIDKDDLFAWWAWKRDMAERLAEPGEVTTYGSGGFTKGGR